jgi:hypothetical protein
MVYGDSCLHQVLRVIENIIAGNISETTNNREYIAIHQNPIQTGLIIRLLIFIAHE